MPIAIGYVRVSTLDQKEHGCSLDAQRAHIEAWCKVNDHALVEIYADEGISGATIAKRPNFQKAVEHVFANTGSTLVIYSLTRASRSLKDCVELAEQFEKRKCNLVSLREHFDTTTAAGKLFFGMMALLGQFERDLVSERTKSALAHKRSKGQRLGNVPYGFRVAEDGITLEVEPAELHIKCLIRELGKRMSERKIQEHLKDRKIQNRAGKTTWSLSAIHKILKQKEGV